MSNLMSRPVVARAAKVKAQGVGAVGLDAVRKLFAGGLVDFLRHLRLHEAGGAFFHQRVEVDAVDDVERIEHVALGLGHFLAFGVAYQAVHIHGLERYFGAAGFVAHKMHGHHDHARHPEENDVEAGDQHIGGMEGFQLGGVFWPAQRGEGPQAGGEPCVEHVVILTQFNVCIQLVAAAHFVFGAATYTFPLLSYHAGMR
jgi:hypothetical protein